MAVSVLDGPVCTQCGVPFVSREGGNHLCGNCTRWQASYDCARSAAAYDGTIRKAVHAFKFGGNILLAKPLGALMAEYAAGCFRETGHDIITAVPLHPLRLMQRGFNQSLMLARTVAKKRGIPLSTGLLRRRRWTAPQTGRGLAQRRTNVRGVFSAHRRHCNDRAVLLIDDVYTSGATVLECAAVLKKQGAVRVDVLTLARTL